METPNPIKFDGVRTGAAGRLRALALAVERIEPEDFKSVSFALSELADPDFLAALNLESTKFAPRKVPAIYAFQPQDRSAYTDLRAAFGRRPERRPKGKKPCCYSRLLREPHPKALYVGSTYSLGSRISQHVGRIGGDGTYAMRLCLWAADLPHQIELKMWRFGAATNPIEIEALEQELWDELRPMLGKRSGK